MFSPDDFEDREGDGGWHLTLLSLATAIAVIWLLA